MTDWPEVTLGNVQRMHVLASTIPHAQLAEAVVDVPFDRVWRWFSDLETSIPAFDGQVRRLDVRERSGTRQQVTARQGPFSCVPLRFDVLLEPDGWCLMTGAARLYVVGMCAEPAGPDRCRVALLEAVPRRIGRLADRFLAHHVAGDVRRMKRLLENAT